MEVILVVALTFGVMFLLDKGFTKLFRSRAQHGSGLAVRLPKMYALVGIVLLILAVVVFCTDLDGNVLLMVGGVIVALMGAALVAYYLSFGIFYDEESFLMTSMGKKSVTYRFSDIVSQQLYVIQGGSVVVELYMADGKAVSIQSKMEGAFAFLDKAFYGWCRQKGMDPEACDFHDPDQCQWFPPVED